MADAIDCGARVMEVANDLESCGHKLDAVADRLTYVCGHDSLAVKALGDVSRRLADGVSTLRNVTQAKVDADAAFAKQMVNGWLRVAERTLGPKEEPANDIG